MPHNNKPWKKLIVGNAIIGAKTFHKHIAKYAGNAIKPVAKQTKINKNNNNPRSPFTSIILKCLFISNPSFVATSDNCEGSIYSPVFNILMNSSSLKILILSS